jgi:hypothetical protein
MKSRLTIEEVRKSLGKDSANYTDEQVTEIIGSLVKLSNICYDYWENTCHVQKLFSDGLSIEDAQTLLAKEGLHYDTKALKSIKQDMEQSGTLKKSLMP